MLLPYNFVLFNFVDFKWPCMSVTQIATWNSKIGIELFNIISIQKSLIVLKTRRYQVKQLGYVDKKYSVSI